MRPNVKTTREALNVAALPPTAGMELDYRTELYRPSKRARLTLEALSGGAIAAIVATLALRLSGAYTATIPFLVGIVLLCVLAGLASKIGGFALLFFLSLAALVFFVRGAQDSLLPGIFLAVPASFLVWYLAGALSPTLPSLILFGPLFWLLSVASNTPFFAAFFLAAVITVLFLADALTRHFALWMNANPYLPRRMRRRWLAVWRPVRRWEDLVQLADSAMHPRACRQPMLATELAERTRYIVGYLAVLVSCLAALVVYLACRDPLMRGTFAVAVFIVLLAAYGIVNVLTYSSPSHPVLALKLLFEAFLSWHTYNIHETAAPGVFQSPYGCAARRRRLWCAAVGALTIVLLPASWYFPIGVPLFGIDSWFQDAAQTQIGIQSYFSLHHGDLGLSDAELRMLGRPFPERDRVPKPLVAQRQAQAAAHGDYQRLSAKPEYALALHVRAAPSLRTTAILSTLFSLLACLAVPTLVLVSTCWAVSARVLLHHHLTLEGEPSRPGLYHVRPRQSRWAAHVSRLRASRYQTKDDLGRVIAERDQLLIGFSEAEDYPVLLSPAILAEHAHITGDSGSGKSSRGIAPLVEQLIERGDCSVVILDLKDDQPIFEAARIAVNRTNTRREGQPAIPLRWFTNQSARSTFVFNPFLQRDFQALTPQQRTEVLLGSLGLDYGEGYGTSYYSSAHRHVLKRVLEGNPQFKSFRQINRFFSDGRFAAGAKEAGIEKKSREEASHLYTVVESLASFDAINVLDDTELPPEVVNQRIDMGDVVRSPHVLYFGLASALEQSSVREIAKLALHSLLVAAVRRGHSKHQVYLFIDEFQQVVSQDLEIVLRQARSHGIAAILANQTLSDLKKGSVDITSTVQANTRFRQVFSASDLLHQNALIDASGEAMYELFGSGSSQSSNGSSSVSQSVHEQIGPRLRRNDIIEATDDPTRSLVQVTRSHGFTQFGGMMFPMLSPFHIAPDTYRRRQEAPWPRTEDHSGTIVTPLAPAIFGETEKTPTQPSRPREPDVQAMMELEQALDAYQGVQTNDEINVKPKP